MFRFVTVADTERAFLIRDGRFRRVLKPGRYQFFDPTRSRVGIEHFYIVQSRLNSEWAEVIEKKDPALARELFEIVSTGEAQVALVSYNGRPEELIGPFEKVYYWKLVNEVDVEYIDVAEEIHVKRAHLNAIEAKRTPLMAEHTIGQHDAGLLYVDGEYVETLKPGRHGFWQVHRKIKVETFDLRPQPQEIMAQEILTKDRVSLRLTLTAFTKITDPVKADGATNGYQTYIYRLIQFAIREAVSNRTLDEVLNGRESVDQQVRQYVAEHLGDIGVEVTEIGVKDTILPGEMRALINKVVEAEKVAQANLIRRREETAATRSLLNTARLMEDNPLLLRLKELESLEKLTEKVGRIDLHTGEGRGLDALLTNLLNLKTGAKEGPAGDA